MKSDHVIPAAHFDAQRFADAEALYEALTQLIHVYQYRDRDRICCHDVSVTQCHAMEILAKQGVMRLQSLAEQLRLDKSTSSRVVESLVKKAYVTRIENPEDRRAVLLSLTGEGAAIYQRIRAELIEEEYKLLADLPPEVRHGAPELLRRLAGAAARRTGFLCETSPAEQVVEKGCC